MLTSMDHWGDHHKYEHKRLKINWFWNRFVSFIIGKLSWQRISYIMLLCQMKKNKVFQTDWTIGSRVTQQYKFVYLNYLGNFKLSGIIVKYWVDPRFCWVLFFFWGGEGGCRSVSCAQCCQYRLVVQSRLSFRYSLLCTVQILRIIFHLSSSFQMRLWKPTIFSRNNL